MNKQIIEKLREHFEENGDKLSLEVLDFRICKNGKPSFLKYDNKLSEYVKSPKVILYGAGGQGFYIALLLNAIGKEVVAFIDRSGKSCLPEIPVITLNEYKENYTDIPIIVSSAIYKAEIERNLSKEGIDNFISLPDSFNDDIWHIFDAEFIKKSQPQYFSLTELPKCEKEVFIDCGVWDGNTTFDFLKWYKNPEKAKVFAFEPDPKMFEIAKKNFEGFENIKLFPLGVSEKEETLRFTQNLGGSKITDDGEIEIEVVSLDKIFIDPPRMFLKLCC